MKKKGFLLLLIIFCHLVTPIYARLPETITDKELETIALIMCNALPMVIPMKSDIQIMKKWGIDYREGFQVTNKEQIAKS